MTVPEMIVEAREQVVTMTAPKMIVEAREQVVTMMALETIVKALGGLSEIHHSRGL
jgi:RNA-splicing ligase RtcB